MVTEGKKMRNKRYSRKKKMHRGKTAFDSVNDCKAFMLMWTMNVDNFVIYKCEFCDGYHYGRKREGVNKVIW